MGDGSVLIVHPRRAVRTAWEQVLDSIGDYPVHALGDALAACTLLDEQTPSLVVCALEMPDLSGVDVLQTARAASHLAETRVLLVHEPETPPELLRQAEAAEGELALLADTMAAPTWQRLLPDGGAAPPAVLNEARLAELDAEVDGLVQVLAEACFKDLPGRLDDLQQALQATDRERLERTAHAIKGTAGNLGGSALQDTAARLENAAPAAAEPELAALVRTCSEAAGQFSDALRAYLADER